MVLIAMLGEEKVQQSVKCRKKCQPLPLSSSLSQWSCLYWCTVNQAVKQPSTVLSFWNVNSKFDIYFYWRHLYLNTSYPTSSFNQHTNKLYIIFPKTKSELFFCLFKGLNQAYNKYNIYYNKYYNITKQ